MLVANIILYEIILYDYNIEAKGCIQIQKMVRIYRKFQSRW